MPVPRRFDRRPPERDLTRINDRIRVPEVRVIDEEGNQVGVMKTPDELAFAQERDLDQVEIALLRVRKRLGGLHDPDLLPILAHEPDLGYTNPVVDPSLVALWRAPVEPTRDRH